MAMDDEARTERLMITLVERYKQLARAYQHPFFPRPAVLPEGEMGLDELVQGIKIAMFTLTLERPSATTAALSTASAHVISAVAAILAYAYDPSVTYAAEAAEFSLTMAEGTLEAFLQLAAAGLN